jgi:hypothetical protein
MGKLDISAVAAEARGTNHADGEVVCTLYLPSGFVRGRVEEEALDVAARKAKAGSEERPFESTMRESVPESVTSDEVRHG